MVSKLEVLVASAAVIVVSSLSAFGGYSYAKDKWAPQVAIAQHENDSTVSELHLRIAQLRIERDEYKKESAAVDSVHMAAETTVSLMSADATQLTQKLNKALANNKEARAALDSLTKDNQHIQDALQDALKQERDVRIAAEAQLQKDAEALDSADAIIERLRGNNQQLSTQVMSLQAKVHSDVPWKIASIVEFGFITWKSFH